MREHEIPVKTEAGQREVGERRRGLPPHARTLLIAVNGAQTVGELRESFRAFTDFDPTLIRLVAEGLVQARAAPAEPAGGDADTPLADEVLRAKQLMTESAAAALGLRGFTLTLKLERSYAAAELAALLPEFQRALAKARGAEFAEAIVARVGALLDAVAVPR